MANVKVQFVRKVGNTLPGTIVELTRPRADLLARRGRIRILGQGEEKADDKPSPRSRRRSDAAAKMREQGAQRAAEAAKIEESEKPKPKPGRKPGRRAASKPAFVEPGGFDKDGEDVDVEQAGDEEGDDDEVVGEAAQGGDSDDDDEF